MSIRIFCIAAFLSSISIAAPLKTTTSLPLSGDDIIQAKKTLNSSDTEDFIFFIKGLDVFPDHENPKEYAQIEDKNRVKKYYIAPFFQAAEERYAVGGQELAEEGIKILMAVNDLVEVFDLELLKTIQLRQEQNQKAQHLNKLQKSLSNLRDPNLIETTKEMIGELEQAIMNLNSQLKTLAKQADDAIAETGSGLRRQVINQAVLKLSFLGVIAEEGEQKLLGSEKSSDIRSSIASMISRASQQGQYGFRNAIYEAGYTKKQRKWISLYRAIRPDVELSSLSTKAVYARSTALTVSGESSLEYGTEKSNIIRSPRLFLAVNGGSKGVCGNARSCNVTLEYTWLGATMAKTAKFGAVIMPLYFEADVSLMQPEFEGSIDCNFKNGFKVKGRADIKDGAVIYDGDVYNAINYNTIEEGACNYDILRGDGDSAAYHAIKNLYEKYMKLKADRAIKARAEKDEYKSFVNKELKYHAENSRKKNSDQKSFETWVGALVDPWVTAVAVVVDEVRNFYWHTRNENSSSFDNIKFTVSIKESNVLKNERMAFDGFTVLCWKMENGATFLAACPSEKSSEYKKKADTDLGKSQQFCTGLDYSCLQESESIVLESNTDGVVEES